MEQNGTTSPTQWEKVPFWEPESSAASVSPSTRATTCIRRPAVAACAVGIIPRRGEGARGVTVVLGRGDGAAAAAAAELRSLAWRVCRPPCSLLTASEPQRLMSAHFNESFSILILFFFPGVLTDLWTRQYPLFAVLQCQMPQSVYIAGVYSFEIKSVGQWELEMLFWRQRGSSEGKGDAATPFFQIYFTTS